MALKIARTMLGTSVCFLLQTWLAISANGNPLKVDDASDKVGYHRPGAPATSPVSMAGSDLFKSVINEPTCCPSFDPTECPQPGYLPIHYGRCYLVSDIDGVGLTRSSDAAWPWYHIGKYLQVRNIVIQICRTGVLGTCAGADQAVPEGAAWYWYDQTGFLKGAAGFVGSISGSNGYGLALLTSAQSAWQVNFAANMTCLHGKCAPCVRLHDKTSLEPATYTGLFPSGYSPYGDTLIQTDANSCVPLLFEPTDCLTTWTRFWSYRSKNSRSTLSFCHGLFSVTQEHAVWRFSTTISGRSLNLKEKWHSKDHFPHRFIREKESSANILLFFSLLLSLVLFLQWFYLRLLSHLIYCFSHDPYRSELGFKHSF